MYLIIVSRLIIKRTHFFNINILKVLTSAIIKKLIHKEDFLFKNSKRLKEEFIFILKPL